MAREGEGGGRSLIKVHGAAAHACAAKGGRVGRARVGAIEIEGSSIGHGLCGEQGQIGEIGDEARVEGIVLIDGQCVQEFGEVALLRGVEQLQGGVIGKGRRGGGQAKKVLTLELEVYGGIMEGLWRDLWRRKYKRGA